MTVIDNAAWANRVTLLRPVAERLRKACEPQAGWRLLDVDVDDPGSAQLPFEDESFDAVLSTFGAMFRANHQETSRELTRVLAPGGTLAVAAWTPDGFVAELLRAVAAYVPSPPLAAALLWGSPGYVATLFADEVACLSTRVRWFTFRFGSAEALVDYFRRDHPPTAKAFDSLDAAAADELYDELVARVTRYVVCPGPLMLPAAWLQTVGARV